MRVRIYSGLAVFAAVMACAIAYGFYTFTVEPEFGWMAGFYIVGIGVIVATILGASMTFLCVSFKLLRRVFSRGNGL